MLSVLKSIRSSVFALCLSFAGAGHAALIDRGGGLVYDDVLDVTWLRDAQYSVTSGFNADPRLTFSQARDFAANLEYFDRARGVSWSDWRLPGVVSGAAAGHDPSGTNSELGYMYYVNLGLSPVYPDAPKNKPASEMFANLTNRAYWTGSEQKPGEIWAFQFGHGSLGTTGANDTIRAWVLRDGDVGAPTNLSVPEPGTLGLLCAALLGIALARRRNIAKR